MTYILLGDSLWVNLPPVKKEPKLLKVGTIWESVFSRGLQGSIFGVLSDSRASLFFGVEAGVF